MVLNGDKFQEEELGLAWEISPNAEFYESLIKDSMMFPTNT